MQEAAKQFTLTTPTKQYIAPDVNPWQFW
jgi:hypothetical protein